MLLILVCTVLAPYEYTLRWILLAVARLHTYFCTPSVHTLDISTPFLARKLSNWGRLEFHGRYRLLGFNRKNGNINFPLPINGKNTPITVAKN